MPTLHVVIPTYNERRTLVDCVERLAGVAWPDGWAMTMWLIDDHSTPDAFEVAEELVRDREARGEAISLVRHEKNRGKGGALQTGFDRVLATDPADDDLVTIQDADLEYNPNDLVRLMEPLTSGRCDAVIGSRWGRVLRPGKPETQGPRRRQPGSDAAQQHRDRHAGQRHGVLLQDDARAGPPGHSQRPD